MEVDDELAEKPYSNILSFWRQRESRPSTDNRKLSQRSDVIRRTMEQSGAAPTSLHAVNTQKEIIETITEICEPEVKADLKAAEQTLFSGTNQVKDVITNPNNSSEASTVSSTSEEETTDFVQDFQARKLATLPRTRKMSEDIPRSDGQKHPLGYYGTMALINSRKYTDHFDIDMELPRFTNSSDGQFSRSWHFDRVKPSSASVVDINIEPSIRRTRSQKDDVNTGSLSEIMQRYKNAKKKIQNEKDKSTESDSDSDMETMKSRLRKGAFESTLLQKVDDRNETIGQRLRRIQVSSLDNLRPIEERTDTKEQEGEEQNDVELRDDGQGSGGNERLEEPLRFSWSGNSDNLGELKLLTSKMRLNPYLSQYDLNTVEKNDPAYNDDDETEAVLRIDRALEYIRHELRNMQYEDQILAKKLIHIRKSLRDMRLEKSSDEYRSMMEDTESSICDSHTMESVSSICEVPEGAQLAPSLKNHGITKMNISRRRFSVL